MASGARNNTAWRMVWIAALAMVGTLPGRTQGLGLVTEPLLRDLHLTRVGYAQLNLWTTLLGALFCIGIGRLQDRLGSRSVLTVIALLLGVVVVVMSRVESYAQLFVAVLLVRGFGQSALSVVSLTLVGQWFRTGLDRAMAVFTVVMTIGFMMAFPVVGAVVKQSGWRVAWAGIGISLLLVLAPIALFFVRRPREQEPTVSTKSAVSRESATLLEALGTPAFWVMGIASALYGLIASGIGLFNESVLQERGFAPNVYHTSLAVTALTGLIGNFLGGFLAERGSMSRLMAVAMLLLMVGLGALPLLHSIAQVLIVATLLGVAGGFVMVLFFSYWGKSYGPAHLGQIQGAAQTLTVVASAVGPLLLAECASRTGSYASVFYVLAGVVGVVAVLAWTVRAPKVLASA